jgi:hypothetical protein
VSKSVSFSVSDHDVLKLLELLDGAGKMQDILASFQKGIKSDKESIGGNFPLVLSLSFVIKVGVFELKAYVNNKGKLLVGFFIIFCFDERENLFSTDLSSALVDNGIAYLSDQHNKSRGSVVELRVSPNKQNGVHNWDE